MGSSLEFKYNLTQLPPGGYHYVKWWDGGTVLRADLRKLDESGKARNGA